MKLLTRTNIYFVLITLVVFALGGTVFFESLRHINKEDATERLLQEKNKILAYVNLHQSLPQNSISLGDSIAFYPSGTNSKEKEGHTKIYNSAEKEYEPYETLEFNVVLKGENYRTIIYKPLLESDDIQQAITLAMIIVSLILIVVLVITNIGISHFIWKPFYSTLERIKSFDLSGQNKLEVEDTSIKEFKEMNQVLEVMTHKMSTDYKSLKEFTENASHELQTPLSIIQSKLELLIQSENLTAKQMEEIGVVYEATSRLSKLNQALLLLAKIENKQFTEIKQVSLNTLIENKLDASDELLKHKNINVAKRLEPFPVEMHPVLADILIANLIGNAIKHNVAGGKIDIELSKGQLVLNNTGNALTVPSQELFQRFRKASQASDSLGLGLAIVKKICDVYGFDVHYHYANNMHTVAVTF